MWISVNCTSVNSLRAEVCSVRTSHVPKKPVNVDACDILRQDAPSGVSSEEVAMPFSCSAEEKVLSCR
ncbi:hypothetical protein PHYPO_G00243170 [Pangasianodon hypophthalmus]|uniref:Uncharacterized protein n=1 Tax=Pangasianodon hypophthalmus TaxID=310915 RepID=A0A5N5ND90_PANHP|nr:hypothetical protein PHYPO_G00243170 [Pangasianodon hypophthalmus]